MPNYLIKYGGNQKIVELEKIIDDYRLYYLNDLFEIKLIFYGLSRMLQFSQFVWPLSYSVWDVFNNFLLKDATDRSKISSDQKRFFIALIHTPFHFSRTLHLSFPFLLNDFSEIFKLHNFFLKLINSKIFQWNFLY